MCALESCWGDFISACTQDCHAASFIHPDDAGPTIPSAVGTVGSDLKEDEIPSHEQLSKARKSLHPVPYFGTKMLPNHPDSSQHKSPTAMPGSGSTDLDEMLGQNTCICSERPNPAEDW